MTPDHSNVTAPATFAVGSLWWLVETVREFGPSWAMIPPLLFGVAAVVNAAGNLLTAARQRRHVEEDRTTERRHVEEDRHPEVPGTAP